MNLSRHSQARCRQRGINNRLIRLIWEEADRSVPCGGGCTTLQISRSKAAAERRRLGPDVERARNTILIVNSEGQVVTAMHRSGRTRIVGV